MPTFTDTESSTMTSSLSPAFVKKFWMCINQRIPSQLIKSHRKQRLASYLVRECCVFEPRWCYNTGARSQRCWEIKDKNRCLVAAVVMEKWVQVVNNVKVIPECKGHCCCFIPEKHRHTPNKILSHVWTLTFLCEAVTQSLHRNIAPKETLQVLKGYSWCYSVCYYY